MDYILTPTPRPNLHLPPNETYLPTPAESIVQPGVFKVEGLGVFSYRRDCESRVSANTSSSPATVCTCEVTSLTRCIYRARFFCRCPERRTPHGDVTAVEDFLCGKVAFVATAMSETPCINGLNR